MSRVKLQVYIVVVAVLSCVAVANAQSIGDVPSREAELIRGVVKPLAEAEIATDIVARIAKFPFRAGERFVKGDVLIEFSCDRQRAELTAARAARTAAKQTYDSNLELAQHDAVGQHEVLQSKADFDQAAGQVSARQAVVNECVLRAPFDGRVVKTHVNAHETPTPGSPLARIIDDSNFELELIVPSAWLSWLRPDTEFDFAVDETGESYAAAIKQIGAAVDPVSQTVMVTGRFQQRPEWVLAGMSGTADFEQAILLGARSGE